MEAIASGIPVITSNCPPFTEFLSHQQALLINPDDVGAIAQAMRLIRQSDVSQALVQASQTILPKYTWENSAQMHTAHYAKMMVGALRAAYHHF
jgi:glycosyltransferase involved in cell wall biosynthesis